MKKHDTEEKISVAFKELLTKNPIEKISVKELCETAGIIRPTFYNHFKDKYEVLEYIIRNELLVPIKPLLYNDMIQEGVALLFYNINKDRRFYEQAMKIEGQNSFESIAREEVKKLLVDVIDEKYPDRNNRYNWITRDLLAEYYANSMCYVAIACITRNINISPRDLAEVYEYLSKHSMFEVIEDFSTKA